MKRVVIKASQNSNKQILGAIYRKARELLNMIEDMPDDLFNESDLKPLYEDLLDAVHDLSINTSTKVKASDTPGSYNGVPLRDDDEDDDEAYIDEWDEGFDDYD